ncbi:hypothetical protein VULLAG_LOCUS1190 [Vulpes lagopus]
MRISASVTARDPRCPAAGFGGRLPAPGQPGGRRPGPGAGQPRAPQPRAPRPAPRSPSPAAAAGREVPPSRHSVPGAVGLRSRGGHCPRAPRRQGALGAGGEVTRETQLFPVCSLSRCLLPSAGNVIRDPRVGTPPPGMWLRALPSPPCRIPGGGRPGTSRGR